MSTDNSLKSVLKRLDKLHDDKILQVNERHGDNHSVNLTKLRAVAKDIKKNDDLARELWESGNANGRLLALLICRPKAYSEVELDAMLRSAVTPKQRDWLLNYVVRKSAHTEALRKAWFNDPDPDVAAAGWELTAVRIPKDAEGLDLPGLLDRIEAEMATAPSK